VLESGIVRSAETLIGCQTVRFNVFCCERGFLSEADYPDQIERDEFDSHATHLAVEHHGDVLGTARLVPHSDLGFPLERYCDAGIPSAFRPTTAEVSRLAVPRSVASRYDASVAAICRSRKVATRLYQTVYRIAVEMQLTHLVAAMEPSLVRILRPFDMIWLPVGPEVDYGGPVRPYLLSIGAFEATKTEAAERFRHSAATFDVAGTAIAGDWEERRYATAV
jgi:N-acyl amino acid synthase of PEP-CTERM/exosortase system